MTAADCSPLCCWAAGGRPVMAYAAAQGRAGRARALRLLPCATLKRRIFRASIRFLMAAHLDARGCTRRESAGALLPSADLGVLLERLQQVCRGAAPDWLLLWPAQPERGRLYLAFRADPEGVSGVVKIGEGDFNRRQLRNEAAALNRLSGVKHPFSHPSVLFEQRMDGGRMALALGRFPRRCRPVSESRAIAFAHGATTHFKDMQGQPARLPLGQTDWFPSFRNRGLAGAAARRLLDRAGEDVDTCFAHGDLGPGNLLEDERGGIFLFDWENASVQAPVLTDAAGLWLACRQRRVLRNPQHMARTAREEFSGAAEGDLPCALAFLSAMGNLAAIRLLEALE